MALVPGRPLTSSFRKELWCTVGYLTARLPWPLHIILVTSLGYSLFLRNQSEAGSHAEEHFEGSLSDADQKPSWGDLKPRFFPAKTTHTRLFPKKHSFSYSYLLVGIPIGWRGNIASLLSVDLPSATPKKSIFRRPWFSIQVSDYLERGDEKLGLRGKLHLYLKSQGEDVNDFPFAYLVTAPRFLGYSFNPVSFWYLYNKDKELRAMILEVNNTFDERCMYLLKDSIVKDPDESWTIIEHPRSRFRDTWSKDFHVSPFNSRKGSYALSAQNPFSPHLNSTVDIDNTITLSSSKAHAKLIARVFSSQPSIDPTALSYWASLRFIASWWWVGFVTFPRIVKEAGKLFFRRKLHVWYRPEVLKDSIGRSATEDEATIERTFRSFLRSLVTHSSLEQPIKYISPIPSSPTQEIFTSKRTTSTRSEAIEFKITTPLFYARLARHSHISGFLSTEILTADDKDRTFHVSHPSPFLHLFEEQEAAAEETLAPSALPRPLHHLSPFPERAQWTFQHWLRRHSSSRPTARPQTDIRHAAFSPLDTFAMRHEPPEQAARYRRAVQKMLLSDVLACGHPEALDAVGYALRVGLSYAFVRGGRYGLGVWVLRCGEE
ncbi:MAG: hypothetical protein LQ345_000275 [Seirophora villosa]|nr:MAG: hypothetical protein LQ345_000275 [Seirophora villosa]